LKQRAGFDDARPFGRAVPFESYFKIRVKRTGFAIEAETVRVEKPRSAVLSQFL
jgi:hypothetical protein